MQEDKSFLGLTFSILIHIAVVLLVLFMPKLNPSPPHETPTQITILDDDPNVKFPMKSLDVPKKDLVEDLKRKTKYVSDVTRRVKEQIIARRIAHPHNSPVDTPALVQEQQQGQRQKGGHARAGGMQGSSSHPEIKSSLKGLEPKPQSQGIGLPNTQEGFGKNILLGPSSIDRVIPGVRFGSVSFLNTDQFLYSTFFNRIGEQFTPRWGHFLQQYVASLSNEQLAKLSAYDRTTVGEFVLDSEGNYMKTFIHHSCGDQGVDMAIVDALQAANSFPNPPKGLIEDDGYIHIHFRLTVLFQPRTGFGVN